MNAAGKRSVIVLFGFYVLELISEEKIASEISSDTNHLHLTNMKNKTDKCSEMK